MATATLPGRVQRLDTVHSAAPAAGLDRTSVRLTLAVAALMGLASLLGLLVGGVYRDNEWLQSQLRGQDLVSLVIVTPLLLGAMNAAHRGSLRGRVVWLGCLGYSAYTYGMFAVGVAFNRLFLVYVALIVLSLAALATGLVRTDPVAVGDALPVGRPRRGVARFLTGIGVVLAVLWTAQVLAANVAGSVPDAIIEAGQPTGVVFVMDLALVVPLMFLAACWLRRGRPWADVLAGVLLVKAVTMGLALLSMGVFNHAAGYALDPLIALWAMLVIGSAWLAARWLMPFAARTPRAATAGAAPVRAPARRSWCRPD
jgi:hypothetical protein